MITNWKEMSDIYQWVLTSVQVNLKNNFRFMLSIFCYCWRGEEGKRSAIIDAYSINIRELSKSVVEGADDVAAAMVHYH